MEILYVLDGEFHSILVDASVQEVHARSAVVTEHAVAEGANITDHVRVERSRLSAELHVSNTPIRSPNVDGATGSVRSVELAISPRPLGYLQKGAQGQQAAQWAPLGLDFKANLLQFDAPFDRVQAVHSKLEALQQLAIPVTVVTGLKTYENMVVAEISAPRTAASGSGLTIAVEFTELVVASSQTVEEPLPLETRAERRQSRGRQAAEEETEEDGEGENVSLAASLVEEHTGGHLIHENRPNGNSLFR